MSFTKEQDNEDEKLYLDIAREYCGDNIIGVVSDPADCAQYSRQKKDYKPPFISNCNDVVIRNDKKTKIKSQSRFSLCRNPSKKSVDEEKYKCRTNKDVSLISGKKYCKKYPSLDPSLIQKYKDMGERWEDVRELILQKYEHTDVPSLKQLNKQTRKLSFLGAPIITRSRTGRKSYGGKSKRRKTKGKRNTRRKTKGKRNYRK